MSSLERLKRRKLVQWTVAYVACAGVVWQMLEIGRDRWGVSDALGRAVDFLLVVGFGVTVVLVWHHGEKGRQRVGRGEIAPLSALLANAAGGLMVIPAATPHRVADTPGELLIWVRPFRHLATQQPRSRPESRSPAY